MEKRQEKIRLDQKEQEKRLQEEKEKSMRQRLLRDRLPKLGNEDLDSFIRFEDVAIEAEIPKNDWLIYFENSLTGQALERFQSCVAREHRANYDTSRDVLLEAMGYSKEEAIHSFFSQNDTHHGQ